MKGVNTMAEETREPESQEEKTPEEILAEMKEKMRV